MEHRILIVSEDAAIRNAYAKALTTAPTTPPVTYKLITVSSAAAAQLQVTRQRIALVVVALAAHNDELFGFVHRMHELYPDLPVLVLHDWSVNVSQMASVARLGARTASYPLENDALRGLVADMLHPNGGKQAPTRKPKAAPAAAAAPPPSSSSLDNAQQPNEAERSAGAQLNTLLDALRRQARAQLVIYTDSIGHIVARRGADVDTDIAGLASLIAGSFVNSVELGRLLRDPETVHLSVHEGQHYDVYSANVGSERLLALFFDKQFADPKLGFVWLLMKRSTEQLRRLDAQISSSGGALFTEQFADSFGDEFDRIFGTGLEESR